ncbi:hypothetical protein CCY99_04420 [Helicobacter sp. 16-1353]|nr:hypothetical protein CCY99_04420 [Helicobacter sp. 16-1353]
MSLGEFENDWEKYVRLNNDEQFSVNKGHDYICLGDKYANNGELDSSYFVQDIWGARKVAKNAPKVHYDVGSSVAGFIAHCLSLGQKIVLIDIRKMDNKMDTKFLNKNGDFTYIQADATNLANIASNSLESLSALCSVEHFGLGRYGDEVAPNAWAEALRAFQRVLKPGGKLYISVPVGQIDKVCFNAHRVYKPQTIIDTLDKMRLLEFGYIDGFEVRYALENVESGVDSGMDSGVESVKSRNMGGGSRFCRI